MIVLKATQEQADKIEALTKAPNLIRFIKDANNNLIVGKEILTDPAFTHLADEFALLEKIEYNPIVTDEGI